MKCQQFFKLVAALEDVVDVWKLYMYICIYIVQSNLDLIKMSTTKNFYTQDLPPKGGYNPIQTSRVALRRILTPAVASGLTIATTVVGGIGYFFNYRYARRDQVELRSAKLAIMPMLLAERDRE
ncbi:Similar to NDUFA13: NADH dehydrogenase [ubiquinone] 1 alpha subcomplex subunit 13 (Pongo pygmaeus) [Cotesia congregata]|uniref:NADH dehydrogenase [ubiquinone] 1 alpha subcomplex subunit 13 n=1 Tax=Cotesia congregata TaxID=51543 RepID=A0A8J2HEB7_COTCN|nr:Similar to NDUFA13: NADH dehydrogenase [ubiquinone] 1 alpha subcomplex subunit 13 (Pongo pygmaeus) [Cotesia congregata]